MKSTGLQRGADLGMRIADALSVLFDRIARGMLVVVTVAFCYETVARYVFDKPTGVVNQLAAYLTALMCLGALGKCLLTQDHIRIDVFVNKASRAARRRM